MDKDDRLNDQVLWKRAHRRVIFKRFLFFYFILIVVSWVYWYKSGSAADGGIPWPIFPTVLLAPLVIALYVRAYWLFRKSAVEKEFEKLKAKQL
jgi:apolipoprotein N-acyltransferase